LIRKNKMDEYLLHEATNRHIALTKTLWSYKLINESILVFENSKTKIESKVEF
jgi:hypothetical protein